MSRDLPPFSWAQYAMLLAHHTCLHTMLPLTGNRICLKFCLTTDITLTYRTVHKKAVFY